MILRGPKSIWTPTPLYCSPVLETTCELEGHESRVFTAVFSPVDDTLLATCSEDATCRLWDVVEGQELFCLREHTDAIYSVRFSPDGTHLLTSGSDGKIIIWDLRSLTLNEPETTTRAVVQTIEVGTDAFGAQYIDDSTVACAIDDTIVLWDVETAQRKVSKTVTAATDYVFGGRERNPDATPWVFCLEQHKPTGLMALGVSDATIRLLDADLNEHVVLKGHARDVTCLTFRSDGAELLSGSGDDLAAAWDLNTLKVRHVFKGHDGTVHDCCYWPGSEEREVCTVSMDRTMRFWNVDSGECNNTIGPDITAKLCLAPNQTLVGVAVSGGENKTNTGNDFRVNVLTKNCGGRSRLAAFAAAHPNRLAAGGFGSEVNGGHDQKERASAEGSPSTSASNKKKKKKKGRKGGARADAVSYNLNLLHNFPLTARGPPPLDDTVGHGYTHAGGRGQGSRGRVGRARNSTKGQGGDGGGRGRGRDSTQVHGGDGARDKEHEHTRSGAGGMHAPHQHLGDEDGGWSLLQVRLGAVAQAFIVASSCRPMSANTD